MPKEIINERSTSEAQHNELVIGWNPIGWVQASVYPPDWKDSGDALHVDLTAIALDRLIKVLKKAQRKAYLSGNRHTGFEDVPGTPGPVASLQENEAAFRSATPIPSQR